MIEGFVIVDYDEFLSFPFHVSEVKILGQEIMSIQKSSLGDTYLRSRAVGGFPPNIKSLPTNVDVELGCDNNGVHSFHNVMLATPKGTAHTMFG